MLANLDGSAHQLPNLDDAAEAVRALEWDEAAVPVYQDDPHLWITLVQSVHNVLYQPFGPSDDLYRDQLVRAYTAVIKAIQEAVGSGVQEAVGSGDDEPPGGTG